MQGILGLLFLIVSLTDPLSNMNQQELIAFMNSIKQQENAGGNYLLEHRPTQTMTEDGIKTVQALGAYGILDINWDWWAKQAGYEGADWRTPEVQDIVAAHKMTEYYNKYGSWDLVAVAWYGGPGAANTAFNEGLSAVGTRGNMENFGPDIQGYVNSVMETYALELEKIPENINVRTYIEQSHKEVTPPSETLKGVDDGMIETNTGAEQHAAALLSALVPGRETTQEGQEEVVVEDDDSLTIEDMLSFWEAE